VQQSSHTLEDTVLCSKKCLWWSLCPFFGCALAPCNSKAHSCSHQHLQVCNWRAKCPGSSWARHTSLAHLCVLVKEAHTHSILPRPAAAPNVVVAKIKPGVGKGSGLASCRTWLRQLANATPAPLREPAASSGCQPSSQAATAECVKRQGTVGLADVLSSELYHIWISLRVTTLDDATLDDGSDQLHMWC
jgi:hypothetical protein